MDYTLVKQVRDNAPLRESFFALARRVFGLSFEEWHRAGWWTDRYVPYTMVYRDGSAAANVSVNRIDTVWRGEALRLVQLGTVMTAPEHRGKGLARSLMEAVLDDWGRTCDGVYLYANGTVLEFYPKFGFVPAREHVCTLPLPARGAAPAEGGFARLDMDTQAGRALLLRCYERSNPFSALPMLDNPGLLMFYCSGFLKDCVYYSSAYDLACVATEEDGVFTCCDFFGTGRCTLEQAVCAAASAASPGAARAGTDRDSFSRGFRQAVGMSPKSYLIQTRINHARMLLLRTGMTAREIAREVGYHDEFFFYRLFRKRVGMTPTGYRELNNALR